MTSCLNNVGDSGLLEATDHFVAQRTAHQGERQAGRCGFAHQLGCAGEQGIAIAADRLPIVGRLASDEAEEAFRRAGFSGRSERCGEAVPVVEAEVAPIVVGLTQLDALFSQNPVEQGEMQRFIVDQNAVEVE